MQLAEGSTATLILAPARGWVWPLDRVPDPAFAEGALGPGLAVDLLDGAVRAPCDGVVVTFNPSHHAVVIRHDSGTEVLIHIGIDTVALEGRGFTPHTAVGARVRTGDLLVECDLDTVALGGCSLATPVVVVAPAEVVVEAVARPGAVEAGAPLFTVRPAAAAAPSAPRGASAAGAVTVGLAHGIHARPAAALARMLREHGLAGELVAGGRRADLTSVVALMRAEIAKGDRAEVTLRGAGAQAALPNVLALIGGDFAEAEPLAAAAAPAPRDLPPGVLGGMTGSPGLALGPTFRHRPPVHAVTEAGRGIDAERARLDAALAAVEQDLARQGHGGALGEVLAAHRELLADPELRALAEAGIAAGKSAGFAWRGAAESAADAFSGGGARLAERRADLDDLAGQVLAQLADSPPQRSAAPKGVVVLAEDLVPSALTDYAEDGVAGIALSRSSPTAHVAIIAAGMGLPLVTGLGTELNAVGEGGEVILDATAATLAVSPDTQALGTARQRLAALQGGAEVDRIAASGRALTRDGAEVAVHANLGGGHEAAAAAVALGAEGCGLLRSEFLFHDRDEPPGEDEQTAAYAAVLAGLGGRPLTLRTLDVGGDKPVRFLAFPREENPALGLRGIRVGLAHPDLLAVQLRAALRAAEGARATLELMVPMIAGLDEWQAVRAALDTARSDLGISPPLRLGLMIETPAAVLLADRLAAHADFFSIGTNDLTQYVLAMDRTSDALAASADPLHPAVLRAIAHVCREAARGDCQVSVCGGLAADPLAIPLLVGLGVTKLSVVPAAVPATKRVVRETHRASWAELARRALDLESAGAVRAFCRGQSTSEELPS